MTCPMRPDVVDATSLRAAGIFAPRIVAELRIKPSVGLHRYRVHHFFLSASSGGNWARSAARTALAMYCAWYLL